MRSIRALSRTLVTTAALAALAACADTPTAGPSGSDRPRFATAADSTGTPPDTIIYEGEQEYEDIAAQVAEYAGHWYDQQGNRVVALTNPAKKDAALRVIDARGEPELAEGETRTGVTLIVQAQYRFTELRDLRNRANFPVLGVQGVSFLDLDEQRNRLFVGIADESARTAVAGELARAGVPAGAAIIEVTGAPEAYQTLQNFFRPLRSGYQIQNAAAGTCTLGVPTIPWWPGYITNSHCTQAFWWNTGTNFFQNVVAAGNFIGAEAIDPPGWPCGAWLCRRSDAAAIPVAAGVPAANQVARTAWFAWHWNPGSINTGGIAPFNVVNPPQWIPALGMVVDKVGRSTGWNRGFVTNTCVNMPAPFPAPPGRLLLCQYFATNMAGPGDSGSPVFRVLPGNNARITGLLWGGIVTPNFKRSIFSSRRAVMADLGV